MMKEVVFTKHALDRVKKRLPAEDDAYSIFISADKYWPTKRRQDVFRLQDYVGKIGRGVLYRRFEDIIFVYTQEIDKYIIITVYVDGQP